MKFLFLAFILPLSSQAQGLPKLDPAKYTVCSMTMNSNNEKKIFEDEMKKSNLYNPIVELTSFGGDDWFQKACASKISCDQLIISGHFAAGFSGELGKRLPLKTMEKAGCSNTCDGIMDNPLEVYLFGCNTMALKTPDRRTPEAYVNHLIDDGVTRFNAEFTSEGRYGRTGDSFKTRIQRSFGGAKKQIYGFDSIGPSGKSIDGYLRGYFAKNPIHVHMQKVEAARLIGNVDTLNRELAKTLSITDFEQCEESAQTLEDRRMCKLLNDKISVDEKLDTIQLALTSNDWIKFIPTINDFFKANPVSGMTAEQKADVDLLKKNKVVAGQIRGLVNITERLLVQNEWIKFARVFGYLTPQQEKDALSKTVSKMLSTQLPPRDATLICSLAADLKGIKITGNVFESAANQKALACLN